MRNAGILPLLVRKASSQLLGGEELCFLGCTSLEQNFYHSELGQGKKGVSSDLNTRDSLFLPKFLKIFFIYFFICHMLLGPFPETLNGCFKKNVYHFCWGWELGGWSLHGSSQCDARSFSLKTNFEQQGQKRIPALLQQAAEGKKDRPVRQRKMRSCVIKARRPFLVGQARLTMCIVMYTGSQRHC